MAGQKNDFSKGSIPRNIISLALPMTVAQLIHILYSIVDRMYLGRLPGHLSLTGLGLCLPIISIVMGFANLCGMGGAPLFSICRGKGEHEEAERVMGTSFTMLLLLGAAITVLCLLFGRPLLYLFGASDVTFSYANDYLTIYSLGTIFVMLGLGMNPFINAQGFGRMGMITVALGAVVNLVLDPIFIFGMDMGVKGAALATVISQACSALWVLRVLTGKTTPLRLKLDTMRLEWARVKRILTLGLSSFVVNLTNSLVQVLCNATLQGTGGDLYVGVMTIINSIREVITMPIQGITSGSQPVLGFNYGAGEYGRVRESVRFTAVVTVGYATVAWVMTLLLPGPLMRMFNSDPALLAVGIPAIRLYYSTYVLQSLQFVGQSVFIGLGRSKHAVFFSLLRKALIVAPLTVLLPAMGMGVTGVFIAEPISNVIGGLSCILTMYFVVYRPMAEKDGQIQTKKPGGKHL